MIQVATKAIKKNKANTGWHKTAPAKKIPETKYTTLLLLKFVAIKAELSNINI